MDSLHVIDELLVLLHTHDLRVGIGMDMNAGFYNNVDDSGKQILRQLLCIDVLPAFGIIYETAVVGDDINTGKIKL